MLMLFTDKEGCRTITNSWSLIEQKSRPGCALAYLSYGGIKLTHHLPHLTIEQVLSACGAAAKLRAAAVDLDDLKIMEPT